MKFYSIGKEAAMTSFFPLYDIYIYTHTHMRVYVYIYIYAI